MANQKQIRNAHARAYIKEVFAARLEDAGFICPDEHMLCWYRIVNEDIIQAVFFFSHWPNLPLNLQIGYGVHPSFVLPLYYTDVCVKNLPWDERLFEMHIWEGEKNVFAPFSDEILVYAPQAAGYGIDTLNSIIFPKLNSIQTLEECYRENRKMYRGTKFGMSLTMIDEAIYLNDVHALENCKRAVEKMIPFYKAEAEQNPNQKEYRDSLDRLQIQRAALWENKREEFLESIAKRSNKNLAAMKKKYRFSN